MDQYNTGDTVLPDREIEGELGAALEKALLPAEQWLYIPPQSLTDKEPACPQAGYPAGDIVQFGAYPQGEKGEEAPIQWLVVEKGQSGSVLLSKDILDRRMYHGYEEGVAWELCDLRVWLNGEFISRAFSPEEQRRLLVRQVVNESGNSTDDRVFLLSIEEAENYFRFDSGRRAKPTVYAVKQGVWTSDDGYCWWWLRSPGHGQRHTVNVRGGVGVIESGPFIGSDGGGVRPALFVNL